MENQVNVISKQVEVLVMTNLTADKEYTHCLVCGADKNTLPFGADHE